MAKIPITKRQWLVFQDELWLHADIAAKFLKTTPEEIKEVHSSGSLALTRSKENGPEIFVRYYDVVSNVWNKRFDDMDKPESYASKKDRTRSLRSWHAAVRNGLPRNILNELMLADYAGGWSREECGPWNPPKVPMHQAQRKSRSHR